MSAAVCESDVSLLSVVEVLTKCKEKTSIYPCTK